MIRPILVTGWGRVGPEGIAGTLPREGVLDCPAPLVPEALRWKHVSMRACERFGRLDDASKYALAAAERAGLPIPDERDCSPRTGIVVGTRLGSLAADVEHLGALANGEPSPALFTYTLPSAGMAEIAIRFKLMGPTLCLMDGQDAGAVALWEAVELIRSGDVDACLCVESDAVPAHMAGALGMGSVASAANAIYLESTASAKVSGRVPLATVEHGSGVGTDIGRALPLITEWLSIDRRGRSEPIRIPAAPTMPSGESLLLRVPEGT